MFFFVPILIIKAALIGLALGNAGRRVERQTGGVDGCVLGCVTEAVTGVGMTNIRPSSWSWKLSDLLQSAVLRSFCQAYEKATTCASSCTSGPSKILVTGLMAVPALLCSASPSAKDCLKDVSQSMKNTCDNKCTNLKPSFGLRTWLSLTRMKNIFNDMCSFWGCQIACEKPAVDRRCGQESKTLMARINGLGMDTLRNALKTVGLSQVCGANSSRIPETYNVVTEGPPVDYGEGGDDQQQQGGGGQATTTGPEVDDYGQEDQQGGGGQPDDQLQITTDTRASAVGRPPSAPVPTTSTARSRTRTRGRGRRPHHTTTTPHQDDGHDLADQDYWQVVRTQASGGRRNNAGSTDARNTEIQLSFNDK